MMSNEKIMKIVEARLRSVPYSIIAYELNESDTEIKKAVNIVVKKLMRRNMHGHTAKALKNIPYVNVVNYITENNISIADLAKMCEVSNQYLCSVLPRRDGISVKLAGRIASVTGMTLSEIYYMGEQCDA